MVEATASKEMLAAWDERDSDRVSSDGHPGVDRHSLLQRAIYRRRAAPKGDGSSAS